ncbi:hypothetical protein R3P38DRAFT_2832734 [Favolaschia claudopus]|uniref:Uncharacterized protein n=1 Tax=Favolaschia claudopus TaxID=2862362 RepID=A0AAW0ECR3_9AGAR
MATQPGQSHVMPIARPSATPTGMGTALREPTKFQIIKILAETANGCLSELGYSPGLLEKVRYLEEEDKILRFQNEQLQRDVQRLTQEVVQLKDKGEVYQKEGVKLWDDNRKLLADTEHLRAELQIYQNSQSPDMAQIVSNSARWEAHCMALNRDIVIRDKEITQLKAKLARGQTAAMSVPTQLPQQVPSQPGQAQGRRVSAPQLQTVAGQPHPQYVHPQTHPPPHPQPYPPQPYPQQQPHPQPQLFPQPQSHPPPQSQLQSHPQPPPHLQPQSRLQPKPQPQSHPLPQPHPQPQLHSQLQSHPQPYTSNLSQPPRANTMPLPQRHRTTPVQNIAPSNRGIAPLSWVPSQRPPLQIQTSLSQSGMAPPGVFAPPPGYGPAAADAMAAVAARRPTDASYYRPRSGASTTSAGLSAGGSTGHRTPGYASPAPPPTSTSPIPLNLQNFAPVMFHPQMASNPHSHRPRTDSSSSASAALRVSQAPMSAVASGSPVTVVHSQTSSQQIMPAMPQMVLPLPPSPVAGRGGATLSPAASTHSVSSAASTHPQPALQQMRPSKPPPVGPSTFIAPDGAMVAEKLTSEPEEMQVDDHVPPETQQQPAAQGMQTDVDADAIPSMSELLDVSSPAEVHEAVTPVDVSRTLSVAVAADVEADVRPSGSVDVDVPPVKEENQSPIVKMEVDESGAGEDDGDDDEEEEGGNEIDYIELGPDGLRTVEDCIAAIFTPKNNYVCRFCESRYNTDLSNGIQSEPPIAMPSATVAERAAHCVEEHEFVWNIMRTNV